MPISEYYYYFNEAYKFLSLNPLTPLAVMIEIKLFDFQGFDSFHGLSVGWEGIFHRQRKKCCARQAGPGGTYSGSILEFSPARRHYLIFCIERVSNWNFQKWLEIRTIVFYSPFSIHFTITFNMLSKLFIRGARNTLIYNKFPKPLTTHRLH